MILPDGPKPVGFFRQGIGRARHALHAAGDEDFAFAAPDRPRRLVHCGKAAGAKTVDCDPRHLLRQSGQQRGHAGDIAVVLARLIGAAEIDLLDLRRIDSRPRDRLADNERRQVIRPHRRQRAANPADGRSHCADNYDFGHLSQPTKLINA